MFGGLLCPGVIFLGSTYLAAFGNSLYQFDNQGLLIRNSRLHKHQIVHVSHSNSKVYSLDVSGHLVVSDGSVVIESYNINSKVQQGFVSSDRVVYLHDNQVSYYSIGKSRSKLKYTGTQHIGSILYTKEYLLVLELNKLHVFSLQKGTFVKTIEHINKIVSADIFQGDVVIGDQKGKIFLHIGGVNRAEYVTQRQWHTSAVNKIILNEGNMITAGAEGVVVFWHLKTERNDFLPRFGAQIQSMTLSEDCNRLACFLTDNSIKVVLLDEDKAIVHLKTIMNPNGVKTKRSIIEDYKFLGGVYYSSQMNAICMNSVPGKLQFIEPYTSSNRRLAEQLDITNRNFVSGLDGEFPDPVEVKCISFSPDWRVLGVCADNSHLSYLKVYGLQPSLESGRSEYQLEARINQPHQNGMIQLVNYQCTNDMTVKFVSIGSDRLLKVWRQKISKKKTLKSGETETNWSCELKFSYKNRQLIAVQPIDLPNSNGMGLTLADKHFILLDLNNGQVLNEIFLQGMESCYYMGSSLAYQTDSMFAVCDYAQKKNLLTMDTLVKRFSVSPSEQSIAVLHQFKGQQLVTLLECKKKKVVLGKSYKIAHTENIEYLLWAEQIPLALTSSLYLIQFGKSKLLTPCKHQAQLPSQPKEQVLEEESEGMGFLQRYSNLVNRRLYSSEVQQQVSGLMESMRELPQVGNSFRLLSDIILL